MTLKKYLKTAQLALYGITNGGVIYLLPDIFMNILYLVPLMFLWRLLGESGVDVGMTTGQMLTYTYVNALLADMMIVQTFASAWNYEGQLLNVFARPMRVFGQIIAQTVGGWIPKLLIFSLPMIIIAPLFDINIIPASLWFFPSLLLCISLGFAVDFVFACVTIRLKGMAWLSYSIRMAIVSLLSGTVIPFKILPFGLSEIFKYQPFGSLGGAPLSIFVGSAEPMEIIVTQLIWNVIIWAVAAVWFDRSRESLVSYGG